MRWAFFNAEKWTIVAWNNARIFNRTASMWSVTKAINYDARDHLFLITLKIPYVIPTKVIFASQAHNSDEYRAPLSGFCFNEHTRRVCECGSFMRFQNFPYNDMLLLWIRAPLRSCSNFKQYFGKLIKYYKIMTALQFGRIQFTIVAFVIYFVQPFHQKMFENFWWQKSGRARESTASHRLFVELFYGIQSKSLPFSSVASLSLLCINE